MPGERTILTDDYPALDSLEDYPRFEAVQARMMEYVNAERAALGLDPVRA